MTEIELFITSVVAFSSTNLDDLFLLALFFASGSYRTGQIYVGQYLGIIWLIAISLAGSLVGELVDSRYVGLLGLFPLYLGLSQLWGNLRENNLETSDKAAPPNSKAGFASIAAVTIANGGDNIGTYVPLFAALGSYDKLIMVGIFLVMVFVWLKGAQYLADHPVAAKSIGRYGHILTPIVLCVLGIYILYENGSFGLLEKF